MASPRRRSARLKNNATPSRKVAPLTALKLSSLLERDETPETGAQSTLDKIVSTPTAPPNTAITEHMSQFSPLLKTPNSRPRPSLEEMHPSKVHQSTAEQPDSGLRLGFADISTAHKNQANKLAQDTPTKTKSEFTSRLAPPGFSSGGGHQQQNSTPSRKTPARVQGSLSTQMTSPGFEFKFASESYLSEEAQRLMDNVREEAARIKAQMVIERSEQEQKDGEADQPFSPVGRKIAKPKGQAGRFSDIHMAEFKRMDSIAGHASAYRAHPGRLQSQPATKSLKRSNSKAGFDEPEKASGTTNVNATFGGSPAKLEATKATQTTTTVTRPPEGLELISPSKRVKQIQSDDTSTGRPLSRDCQAESNGNSLPRSKSGLPVAITTPTKASLARSASVKHLKTTTTIRSLTRSPSTKTIATIPKTEGRSKYKSGLPTLSGLKSILRRHQPLFSNDPVKIAAGTHVASPASTFDSNLNKDLPNVPGDPPLADLGRTPSIKKHVEFTPSTRSRYDLAAASPSPSKIPAPHVKTTTTTTNAPADVVYPTLPGATPPKQEINSIFTKLSSPTIRRVRDSNISYAAPMISFADLPQVPHGMPNKKRRREESDNDADDEKDKDIENKMPGGYPTDADGEERSSKRLKATPAEKKEPPKVVTKRTTPGTTRGGSVRPKGKGILSMSRLNMLSRPKERR